MKSYTVYLAAPWFSPEQKERHDIVLALIEQHTDGVRAPSRIFVCPPDAGPLVRQNTFRGNLDEIRGADFVIAITDGKDPGTLWEMGYAYARGIQVVGVALTLGDQPFNLMLAEGCTTTCRTIPQLEDILTHYDKKRQIPPHDWEGTIE